MAKFGLFATPDQIRQAQMTQGQDMDFARASLPAGRGIVALGSQLGRLAGNIPRLFGAVTPAEKVAQTRQSALSAAQHVAGNDPNNFLKVAASNLIKVGDYQGAFEIANKLQSLMAAQAGAAKDVTAARLNAAKTGNELNRFSHEDALANTKIQGQKDITAMGIEGQKDIQDMKARQSTKELNASLSMKGIQLTHDDMNKYQDRLIKVQDLKIKADRATSYQQSVEDRKDYWTERLSIMHDKLAQEAANSKSLNASRRFTSLMGQATVDFKKAATEQMATEILGIPPEKAAAMSQTALFNRLPAPARNKLTKDFSDFISRLSPMQRFTKTKLPSQDSIAKYAPSTKEPDLFADFTKEK